MIKINFVVEDNKLALHNHFSEDVTEEEAYFTIGILDKLKHSLVCMIEHNEEERNKEDDA